jgi:hypothetical protein
MQVVSARSNSVDPRNNGRHLKGKKLVLEVCWPKEFWVLEGEFIPRAGRCREQYEEVKGHIQDLIHLQDSPEFSTACIRNALVLDFADSQVSELRCSGGCIRSRNWLVRRFGERFGSASVVSDSLS